MRVRALDMALAMLLGGLVGVYVLQSAQAANGEGSLRAAMAKRDEVALQLKEAKEALVLEQVRQREERLNLTALLRRQPGSLKVAPQQQALIARREGDSGLSSEWSDFPCALRELKVAKVTKTCEVACRDSLCERARLVCDRLVECDAVVVGDGDRRVPLEKLTGKTDLSSSMAQLVRDVEAAKRRDASLAMIESSRWFKSPSFKSEVRRPRTYLVVSYGGCGSKMLAGWLSSLDKGHRKSSFVTRVYHLHDASPPKILRELPPPRAAPSTQQDFRARRFPGGGRFRSDTPIVDDLDAYRVLFIFKDPVEALVSRYGHGHCLHLDGDCAPEEAFPKLDAYATRGKDNMGILRFFDNYAHPPPDKTFPVVLLNYHKLWDNLDALMLALGLPTHLKDTVPERTETVRNDLTARAEQNQAHSEATRRKLDSIYQPIIEHIRHMPAVSLA